MNEFIDRIIRAVKLDGSLYAEVAADRNALGQAIGIVVLSSLASGMGVSKGGIEIVSVMMLVFVIWWVWSFIAYMIGTRLFGESQTSIDYLGLVRAVGFAHAPGILQICGLIPVPRHQGAGLCFHHDLDPDCHRFRPETGAQLYDPVSCHRCFPLSAVLPRAYSSGC